MIYEESYTCKCYKKHIVNRFFQIETLLQICQKTDEYQMYVSLRNET